MSENAAAGEIETSTPGTLESVTGHVALVLADKHGHGAVVDKIQAHVIVAVA